MFETPDKTISLDEFLAFLDRQPDGGLKFELHQGVVVDVSPAKVKQTNIAARLIRHVGNFVDENGQGGFVASSDGGFKIPPEDFYAPDMAYYSKERVPEEPDDDFYPVAPDLAVEVVSASDSTSAPGKVIRYLELGTRMAWVVYPKRKRVDVYRPTADGVAIRTLDIDGTLDGEDVLPGFTLPVRKIFAG
jgi:Uma2 family endonuclease